MIKCAWHFYQHRISIIFLYWMIGSCSLYTWLTVFVLPAGAVIHIVEIDPLVISASIKAMGFPAFSVMTPSGERALSKPSTIDEVLWKGIHERLYLYESDAEKFVLDNPNLYDMVFIDAYDGEDIFPRKLWDPSSQFLKSLSNQLHPGHGTVVVNLHSDSDILDLVGSAPSFLQQILPMGKYVSGIGRAYKDVLVGSGSCGKEGSGLGFTVSVPWVCNTSLVVCRGLQTSGGCSNSDLVMNTISSKSLEVENLLNLPFSCLQYIKRGFILVEWSLSSIKSVNFAILANCKSIWFFFFFLVHLFNFIWNLAHDYWVLQSVPNSWTL